MTPQAARSTFYYRADGKVFSQAPSANATPVEHISEFARTLVDRLEQRKGRHGWKGGSSDDPANIYQKRQTWGGQAEAADEVSVPVFSTLTPGINPGCILYALNMSGSAGVFAWNAETREEKRFFHREAMEIQSLVCNASTGEIIYSMRNSDGTVNLALIDAEGRRRGTITTGDSLDFAPCFDPRSPSTLVYQSAGIARTREGHFAGTGPFALESLNFEKGTSKTIVEDGRFDYLSPVALADGSVLAIRRPYAEERGSSFGQIAKDIVLAPYRLGLAVIGFLNAFTMMFGRERLQSAGAPRQREGRDQRGVWLQGQWIALKDNASAPTRPGETPKGLVPASWALVRITENDGHIQEQELATGMANFAVSPDNTLYASDGRSVWQLSERGNLNSPTRTQLFSAPIIEEFIVVAAPSASAP